MALLYQNSFMKRTEICEIMQISSGSLEYDLKKLKSADLIDCEYQMIDDKPRKVYFVTSGGVEIFEKLRLALE